MLKIDVVLELGKKRTFASVLAWPGWCRIGGSEADALQALLDYAPRYADAIRSARLEFLPPGSAAEFVVVERLPGSATTDFGAPGGIPTRDGLPLEASELLRLQAILQACWHRFDEITAAATGKELHMGPRGGGRDVDGIVEHVAAAEAAYLSQLGVSLKGDERRDKDHVRQAILNGLAAAARGEIPTRGPRGGLRWPPRYAVRRAAWHILDHAWEIEDRRLPA